MDIRVNIEQSDIMAFNRRILGTNSNIRKQKRRFQYLYCPLIFLSLAVIVSNGVLDIKAVVVCGIACLVCILILPKIIDNGILRRVKAELKKPENQIVLGEFLYGFDENGISIKTSRAETSFDWSVVHKIDQTDEYFFVYISSNSAYIIPKSQLDSEQIVSLQRIFQNRKK